MTCACGAELTGRQRRWCSDECAREGTRAALLWQRFNLTPDDYDLILAHQGGKCAVCDKPPKDGTRLVVDHSHGDGAVRGLLCGYCNLRVIAKHKDFRLLERAANYLRDPPARRALGRDVVAPGRARKKRTRRKKAA